MVKLKIHPDILNYYGKDGPPPKTPLLDQIRLLAMRGSMARAGATRSDATAKTQYAIDPIDPIKTAKYLADAFEFGTPPDGSVFWSGADPQKLKKKVNSWNKQPGNRNKFGQLEATTDARFLDGAFEYNPDAPGANENFWKLASQRYGKGALGHVTAVQVFGLKEQTIFWKDELPEILNGMRERLKQGLSPDVVDLSIVVIEPVGGMEKAKIFTNLAIANAPIYKPKPNIKYPSSRNECVKLRSVGHAFLPIEVRNYWAKRGSIPASTAAARLASMPSAVRYG